MTAGEPSTNSGHGTDVAFNREQIGACGVMFAYRRVLHACLLLLASGVASAAQPAPMSIEEVQRRFYNGQYADAAVAAQELPTTDRVLEVYELRTTTGLFRVRRAIGEPADKVAALRACEICPAVLETFARDFEAGRQAAKAQLALAPHDPETLFFLGKLNLNFVWLHLGTLGRRTGWNEYWEARHSLDAALAEQPTHLRARVARAWIDYIVDTKMPWGTGWLLGGGNKKRALTVMRAAADATGDAYVHAEALFGLWDMQVREKQRDAARQSAQRLIALFPENVEVARFVRTGSTQVVQGRPAMP